MKTMAITLLADSNLLLFLSSAKNNKSVLTRCRRVVGAGGPRQIYGIDGHPIHAKGRRRRWVWMANTQNNIIHNQTNTRQYFCCHFL